MTEEHRRTTRVQIAMPIRVRGMSTENKFFDETTETILVSRHGLMTRIKNVVELDTEVHVVNTQNDVAGTFTVVWVDRRDRNGFHNLGLQMLESEAEMWGIHFPDTRDLEEESSTQAWLECTRCHQKKLGTVPLTELEYLDRGVFVARPCDKCKATTAWEFTVEDKPETPSAASEVAPIPPDVLLGANENVLDTSSNTPAGTRRVGVEQRARIRAPLKLTIKVVRDLYGISVEDIGETINVSRNGAYFLTGQNYHVGETVKVHLPYRKGSLNLPVMAKVVRQDQPKGSFYKAAAIHMEEGVQIEGLEDSHGPAPAARKKVDQRARSRVPLKFPIKVSRQIQGRAEDDFGETINISRSGVYFRTSQNYKVGEIVQIVMPYKQGEIAIPVSAKVVRQDRVKDSFQNGVALDLEAAKKPA